MEDEENNKSDLHKFKENHVEGDKQDDVNKYQMINNLI